jgi:hypothetical protein
MDQTGRRLAKWIYLGTAAVTAVVCVIAAALGHMRLAWGFLAGSAIGGLALGGLILMVYVMLAPATGMSGVYKGGAVALQILKYLVIMAALYLLIVRWKVDLAGLAAGLIVPVIVCFAIVAWRPRWLRSSGAA